MSSAIGYSEIDDIELRDERGVYHTTIVGISKNNANGVNRQDILKQCELNESLQLFREPTNPYDENAIAIFRQNGDQLGYIKREIAE